MCRKKNDRLVRRRSVERWMLQWHFARPFGRICIHLCSTLRKTAFPRLPHQVWLFDSFTKSTATHSVDDLCAPTRGSIRKTHTCGHWFACVGGYAWFLSRRGRLLSPIVTFIFNVPLPKDSERKKERERAWIYQSTKSRPEFNYKPKQVFVHADMCLTFTLLIIQGQNFNLCWAETGEKQIWRV